MISYWDATNDKLKIGHCVNIECSLVTSSTIQSTGDKWFHSSITIGIDGLGLIVFRDTNQGSLKSAHCANLLCSKNFRRR